jgi:hypothetical protein
MRAFIAARQAFKFNGRKHQKKGNKKTAVQGPLFI